MGTFSFLINYIWVARMVNSHFFWSLSESLTQKFKEAKTEKSPRGGSAGGVPSTKVFGAPLDPNLKEVSADKCECSCKTCTYILFWIWFRFLLFWQRFSSTLRWRAWSTKVSSAFQATSSPSICSERNTTPVPYHSPSHIPFGNEGEKKIFCALSRFLV